MIHHIHTTNEWKCFLYIIIIIRLLLIYTTTVILHKQWMNGNAFYIFYICIIFTRLYPRTMVRKSLSLHGRKSTPTTICFGTAEAYSAQIFRFLWFMPPFGVRSPWLSLWVSSTVNYSDLTKKNFDAIHLDLLIWFSPFIWRVFSSKLSNKDIFNIEL